MLSDQINLKLRELASQVAEQVGCIVYDLEFHSRVLRIFIDKEGGPSIEDCSQFSKGLNLILDTDDPIPGGAYSLEVSTPGLERVLKLPWHFSKVQGKKIWIRVSATLGSFGLQANHLKTAKQLTEVLQQCEAEGLHFQIADEKLFIPFGAIEKAHLVFEMNEKPKASEKRPKSFGHKGTKDENLKKNKNKPEDQAK